MSKANQIEKLLTSGEIAIREGDDSDSYELVDLIGSVFKEYEGCVLDLEGIDKELLHMKSYCEARGGNFWVAVHKGVIVGCSGYIQKDNVVELKRLYVAKKHRGKGLGSRLTDLVIFSAMELSARAVDCWSDTRFLEAHDFYLHKGFERLPQERALNDPSNTREWRFMRLL